MKLNVRVQVTHESRLPINDTVRTKHSSESTMELTGVMGKYQNLRIHVLDPSHHPLIGRTGFITAGKFDQGFVVRRLWLNETLERHFLPSYLCDFVLGRYDVVEHTLCVSRGEQNVLCDLFDARPPGGGCGRRLEVVAIIGPRA